MNLKVVVAILIAALTTSLVINAYLLILPSKEVSIYVANIQLTDLDWKEQLLNASDNLYFIRVNFNLTNTGNSTKAIAFILFEICDPQNNTIKSPEFRFYYSTTDNNTWVGAHDVAFRESMYYYPPLMISYYNIAFSYHKPEGVQTHVEATVIKSLSTS